MTLTAKQESFCQAIASGMNQSDAYRSAYDAGKMKPESINQVASKLMTDLKVSSRVAELKAELVTKALWTREDSVQTLRDIATDSEAKAAEKVSAVKELNLMHGFNAPTKLELGGSVVHRVELVPMDDSGKG